MDTANSKTSIARLPVGDWTERPPLIGAITTANNLWLLDSPDKYVCQAWAWVGTREFVALLMQRICPHSSRARATALAVY
jgi:hypothetical protein